MPQQESPGIFADGSDFLANQGQYIIDIYHIPTGGNVRFKAWVKSFSDSFQSNWNTEDVYGRMDPLATFQNTKRIINLEWDVVAASLAEAKQNMGKCELLFSMLYPSYDSGDDNASNLSQAPVFKIKFGNLIGTPQGGAAAGAQDAGLLGTMGGFEYSPDFEAGFFTPEPGVMLPQLISLTAEYQVLHNFPVGWKDKSFGEDGDVGFPYGAGIGKEEAWRVSVNEGGVYGSTSEEGAVHDIYPTDDVASVSAEDRFLQQMEDFGGFD